MSIKITVAKPEHHRFAEQICQIMEEAARVRGTGIAKRAPEYIKEKISEGKAVIAIDTSKNRFAGFCYIENWSHDKYIANSGLIVDPDYRRKGLAKRIKKQVFNLSREKYPDAKIFGITTSMAVMKINSDMGYKPVTFSELTQDEKFWNGCQSCPNYDILTSKERKDCLCTGMLYDPAKEEKDKTQDRAAQKAWRWEKFKRFLRLQKLKAERKTQSLMNSFKLSTP